jgi:Protein of unknown function (DUF3703)
MEYLIGIGIALGVGVFATLTGFEKDRAFYPTALIVTASYYDLFSVMGDMNALRAETAVFVAFVILAVVGFKTSLWVVVAALLGHGVFDFAHGHFVENAGVPQWWPMFCLSFDAAAAGYLAWLLLANKVSASRPSSFRRHIHPHVERELLAARGAESAGDAATSFHHLERAHVLGQASTAEHVRVHLRMLAWGVRHRSAREVTGQLLRIIGAATKTGLGLVPHGNTGGSNVGPFKVMPVPADLAETIASASDRPA